MLVALFLLTLNLIDCWKISVGQAVYWMHPLFDSGYMIHSSKVFVLIHSLDHRVSTYRKFDHYFVTNYCCATVVHFYHAASAKSFLSFCPSDDHYSHVS